MRLILRNNTRITQTQILSFMKKKLITIVALCLAISAVSFLIPTGTYAQEPELGDDVIYCHCTRLIHFHPKGCYVNTGGDVCAQSTPGGNVDCTKYDSNCA